MKRYAISLKLLNNGRIKTHKQVYHIKALTRFEALLKACRKVDRTQRSIDSVQYVVNLSGPAHL